MIDVFGNDLSQKAKNILTLLVIKKKVSTSKDLTLTEIKT